MEHIAIDIGGRESQICRRSADGSIVEERRVLTQSLGGWFSGLAPSRVVFETCAESFWLADLAKEAGHDVRVVAASLVAALGVGSRRTKTDRRDAQIVSEVSCRIDLPSVHITSTESRQRKSMLSMRDGLVQSRTLLINTVRGWMRGNAIRCGSGGADNFPARVRKAVSAPPPYVERQLRAIESLSKELYEADDELSTIAKADPTCPRLMSVPGIGPVTAIAFAATLDRVERFESAHKLQAYLGLTPGEYSSSDRQRRTGITKAGSTRLRWLLVQAAWALLRVRPAEPISLWAAEITKRRGKRVAVVAVARKLAGILFALWRDGTFYSPTDAAKAPAGETLDPVPPHVPITA